MRDIIWVVFSTKVNEVELNENGLMGLLPDT